MTSEVMAALRVLGHPAAMDDDPLLSAMPFAVSSGFELLERGADLVEGRVDWAPERCTAAGILHGAVLMGLADTLGAVCAFLNLPPGAGTSTIESKTNFFRAVREGTVHGRARPVHVGRTTIGVQTELRDDQDRLVALTFQTQAVLTG
ncbi:MAG TPA: PaaI family thioesterase [Acidimicrobiales bacterium]|nr:PaaI family thioesterase [Acidimicrobiales bacterium]